LSEEKKKQGARYWLRHEDQFVELSATEVVERFRQGLIDGETSVQVSKDAPSKPLRLYLQELVWDAFRDSTGRRVEISPPEHFKIAFEHAPIGMARSDLAGRITDVNHALVKLLGYSIEELIGSRVGEISDERDRPEEIRLGMSLLAGEIDSYQMEKRFRSKEGKSIDTMLAISLVRDSSQAPQEVLAQVLDLTDYKSHARELEAKERLVALTKLSAGIAHDYGNILNVILGASCRLEMTNNPEVSEPVEIIEGAVKAAVHLNRNFKHLVSRPTVQPLHQFH